jgi:hypothetical protein
MGIKRFNINLNFSGKERIMDKTDCISMVARIIDSAKRQLPDQYPGKKQAVRDLKKLHNLITRRKSSGTFAAYVMGLAQKKMEREITKANLWHWEMNHAVSSS